MRVTTTIVQTGKTIIPRRLKGLKSVNNVISEIALSNAVKACVQRIKDEADKILASHDEVTRKQVTQELLKKLLTHYGWTHDIRMEHAIMLEGVKP